MLLCFRLQEREDGVFLANHLVMSKFWFLDFDYARHCLRCHLTSMTRLCKQCLLEARQHTHFPSCHLHQFSTQFSCCLFKSLGQSFWKIFWKLGFGQPCVGFWYLTLFLCCQNCRRLAARRWAQLSYSRSVIVMFRLRLHLGMLRCQLSQCLDQEHRFLH